LCYPNSPTTAMSPEALDPKYTPAAAGMLLPDRSEVMISAPKSQSSPKRKISPKHHHKGLAIQILPADGSGSAPDLFDFSRNQDDKQDTFMKLINVNTFESLDYGIGLRPKSPSSKRRPKSANPRPMAAQGSTGESTDPNAMKLIVRIIHLVSRDQNFRIG